MTASRIAFLHTGAVVIAPVMERARAELPDTTIVNYLDDRIVADLADPARAAGVPGRLADLARAAKRAGAASLMFTCSSISGHAAATAAAAGIPVLRIDEAMADDAVASGGPVRVIATLPTTCEPTLALLRERAEIAGTTPAISAEVVDGAFAAVSAGDRGRHDELVAAAITRAAGASEVVVLAQASMASAASRVHVEIPVLTSIAPGIRRLATLVRDGAENIQTPTPTPIPRRSS